MSTTAQETLKEQTDPRDDYWNNRKAGAAEMIRKGFPNAVYQGGHLSGRTSWRVGEVYFTCEPAPVVQDA